jgi:hypothetical protein
MNRRAALRAAGAAVAGVTLPTLASSTVDARTQDPASSSDRTRAEGSGARSVEFVPRSRLPLRGAKEAVVDDAGETACVATTDGFATVDVSDPTDPSVLAERRDLLADREDGPMRRVFDVALQGERLAVVGPASGRGLSGLLVYDVADPADPQRVAVHETEFAIHNCDVSGDHVYLTATGSDRNSLVAVEVRTDPPVETARWSVLDAEPNWTDVPVSSWTLHDVTVADGVAYCAYWDAGTWLLDVADPSTPQVLGKVGGHPLEELRELSRSDLAYVNIEPPGNAHFADVSDDGSVLAVGGESWDGYGDDDHGGPSGIDLYDVTEPADPELLSTVEPTVPRNAEFRGGVWTTAHNFELTGGRLYSSWYQDGVKVHDVSDPANPEELSHWRDPEGTRFWTAQVGRAGEFFVATDMGGHGETPDDAALYTFPDAAGSQPGMPSIETATPTATPSDASGGSPTASGRPTSSTDAARTATDLTPTPRDETGTATTDTTAPGVGILGALAGLGMVAWRRVRSTD